jgi:hypothetical protein
MDRVGSEEDVEQRESVALGEARYRPATASGRMKSPNVTSGSRRTQENRSMK